jgi:hypothetical protein
MGSSKEAKKAPVDIIANVIDTLDTFIAAKNASQCIAIKKPTAANFSKELFDTFNLSFLNKIKIKINTAPKNILNQTKGKAFIEIKSPNTAVKPQMKTIKCK